MPRKQLQDDIYWNATESDSDESLRNYHSVPDPDKDSDIDPWDLENYAYIREHLESMELSESSGPTSLPLSGSSGGSRGDFTESNSNSFFYVPGGQRRGGSEMRHNDGNGDYADIEEVRYMSRRPSYRRSTNNRQYDYYDNNENPYELGRKQSSVFGIYDQTGRFRKVSIPVAGNVYKTPLDRTMSSQSNYDYDPYVSRHEIYSRLDEMRPRYADSTIPIYDDVKRLRRRPNFGLTNYGHLKIDYSLSWNNLNKYIRYHN